MSAGVGVAMEPKLVHALDFIVIGQRSPWTEGKG